MHSKAHPYNDRQRRVPPVPGQQFTSLKEIREIAAGSNFTKPRPCLKKQQTSQPGSWYLVGTDKNMKNVQQFRPHNRHPILTREKTGKKIVTVPDQPQQPYKESAYGNSQAGRECLPDYRTITRMQSNEQFQQRYAEQLKKCRSYQKLTDYGNILEDAQESKPSDYNLGHQSEYAIMARKASFKSLHSFPKFEPAPQTVKHSPAPYPSTPKLKHYRSQAACNQVLATSIEQTIDNLSEKIRQVKESGQIADKGKLAQYEATLNRLRLENQSLKSDEKQPLHIDDTLNAEIEFQIKPRRENSQLNYSYALSEKKRLDMNNPSSEKIIGMTGRFTATTPKLFPSAQPNRRVELLGQENKELKQQLKQKQEELSSIQQKAQELKKAVNDMKLGGQSRIVQLERELKRLELELREKNQAEVARGAGSQLMSLRRKLEQKDKIIQYLQERSMKNSGSTDESPKFTHEDSQRQIINPFFAQINFGQGKNKNDRSATANRMQAEKNKSIIQQMNKKLQQLQAKLRQSKQSLEQAREINRILNQRTEKLQHQNQQLVSRLKQELKNKQDLKQETEKLERQLQRQRGLIKIQTELNEKQMQKLLRERDNMYREKQRICQQVNHLKSQLLLLKTEGQKGTQRLPAPQLQIFARQVRQILSSGPDQTASTILSQLQQKLGRNKLQRSQQKSYEELVKILEVAQPHRDLYKQIQSCQGNYTCVVDMNFQIERQLQKTSQQGALMRAWVEECRASCSRYEQMLMEANEEAVRARCAYLDCKLACRSRVSRPE